MRANVLLEERRAGDPVRVAFENQRTILEQREQYRRDRGVVPHQVSLRYRRVFEEDLAQTGDVQEFPAPECQLTVTLAGLEPLQLPNDVRSALRFASGGPSARRAALGAGVFHRRSLRRRAGGRAAARRVELVEALGSAGGRFATRWMLSLSRWTSRASLSSRTPRKIGCRSLPSDV